MQLSLSSVPPQIVSFTVLDWALVAALLWSTVMAFVHGLLREVCSLVGLVAGVLLASWYFPSLRRGSSHGFPPPPLRIRSRSF